MDDVAYEGVGDPPTINNHNRNSSEAKSSTNAKRDRSEKVSRRKTKSSETDDLTSRATEQSRKENQTSENEVTQRYFWDINRHGLNISVLEDHQDTIRRSVARQYTDGARGSIGYNKGRHTFKFIFNDKPWGSHCAIGVCSAHSRLSVKGYQHLFGADALSWAWDIPSGCLLHGGETKQMFKDKMNIKVMYMTLDMNRGTLYFQPKGMERFQAFSGLKDGGKELLYPAVSLVYGLAEVRISLKHSSYPAEKAKKLSKRRSKSMEKSDHERMEKDERNVKSETRHEDKNDNREPSKKDGKPKEKHSRVSFKMSDNEDKDSSSGSERRESDFQKNITSDNGRVKPNEPVLTRYGDSLGEASNLAPLDPDLTSNSSVYSQEKRPKPDSEKDENDLDDRHSETRDDQEENESNQSLPSKTSRDRTSNESEQLLDSPKMSAPADDMTESDGGGSEMDDDEREPLDNESEENLYLKKSTSKDHELFLVQGDSLQKEFVTERQRTNISMKRPTILDRESTLELFAKGIPEPASYSPRRETVFEEESQERTESYQNPFSFQNRSHGEKPEAIKRYLSSMTSQSTSFEYEQPLEDLDEPEDVQYVKTEYLNEEEQYDLQVTHGWDLNHKGGGIQLYPNIPYICVPIPRFHGKVQSVRSKRGVSWGIHKWLIRELPFYSPSLNDVEDDDTSSGIHIGVVSEEYRWFNQGFQIHCSGRYTWSWDSAIGQTSEAGIKSQSSDSEQGSINADNPAVNLQTGVILTLNLYKHKVTLTTGGKVIAEIKNIRGKEIFPYVLFNQKGYYPVEIKYLEGPEEYVDKVLNELKTKDGKYGEFSTNFQGLAREISTSTSMVSVETGITSAPYEWGVLTTGLKSSWGRTISLSKNAVDPAYHYLAIAQSPLYGGRHKIDFETRHITNFIFGLVSENFDQNYISQIGPIRNSTDSKCVTTLGTNSYSWGWDPKTSSIFHGGRFVGKYPRKELEVDWTNYPRLRMMVDFGHNGYNIVSFRVLDENNRPLDLGIAFVNLPDCVWPAVAVIPGDTDHNIKLHMDYAAGPKEFVTEMKSGACAIL